MGESSSTVRAHKLYHFQSFPLENIAVHSMARVLARKVSKVHPGGGGIEVIYDQPCERGTCRASLLKSSPEGHLSRIAWINNLYINKSNLSD